MNLPKQLFGARQAQRFMAYDVNLSGFAVGHAAETAVKDSRLRKDLIDVLDLFADPGIQDVGEKRVENW